MAAVTPESAVLIGWLTTFRTCCVQATQDIVMAAKPTDSANPIATSGFLEGIDAAAVQAMKRPRIEAHQHVRP